MGKNTKAKSEANEDCQINGAKILLHFIMEKADSLKLETHSVVTALSSVLITICSGAENPKRTMSTITKELFDGLDFVMPEDKGEK